MRIEHVKKINKLQAQKASIPSINADLDIKEEIEEQLPEKEVKFSEHSFEKIPKFLSFPKGKVIKSSKGKIIPFKNSRIINKGMDINYSIGTKQYYSKRENLLINQQIERIPYDFKKPTTKITTSKDYKPSREVTKEPVTMKNEVTQFDSPSSIKNDIKIDVKQTLQHGKIRNYFAI